MEGNFRDDLRPFFQGGETEVAISGGTTTVTITTGIERRQKEGKREKGNDYCE